MELDDLIQNVKDFFLNQYKSSTTGTSNTFLAFEPLGHMISPDDFKFNGDFNQTVATEQLSLIADVVPAIDNTFMPDAIDTVSGGYGNLLTFISFNDNNIPADSLSQYMSLFGNIKSKATQAYSSQASIQNPSEEIYVCNGSPSTWYDQNSQIWQHKNFSTATTASTGTPPSLPAPPQPVVWKLNPIATKIQQNAPVLHILNNPAIVNRLNLLRTNTFIERPMAATVSANPTSAVSQTTPATTEAAPHLAATPIIAKPMVTAAQPQPAATVVAANTTINPALALNKTAYRTINTSLPLNQMVLLNRAIGTPSNTQTGTVQSSQFSMDLDYSLVYLTRPWIDQDILREVKLWYSLTHKAGYYSTGANNATNNGILRAVPKAMIVIKNLNITAQWSVADKEAATSAYGLGAFNISNSNFTNNTLSAPGIQIIGWVCEVLPELPINDDTAMS